MASAYGLTGLAAVTAPFALERRIIAKITMVALFLAGMAWLFLALTVYFGHVGLTDV